MANRGRPTLQKRQRERARQDRQKDKSARRDEAKTRRASAPERTGDLDPDIAHIAPGPQPLSDWQEELRAEQEAEQQDDLQDG